MNNIYTTYVTRGRCQITATQTVAQYSRYHSVDVFSNSNSSTTLRPYHDKFKHSHLAEVTVVSSTFWQLHPLRQIRRPCPHLDSHQIGLASSLAKRNPASKPFACERDVPPKNMVRTQLSLQVVCDMVLVPRLPEPASHRSTMEPYVPKSSQRRLYRVLKIRLQRLRHF